MGARLALEGGGTVGAGRQMSVPAGGSTRGEQLLCEGTLFPASVVVWAWEAQEPSLPGFQVFRAPLSQQGQAQLRDN